MAVNAKYGQDGDSINYTPSAAVGAGAVVLVGDLIGVAKSPIAASDLGSLALEGAYRVLKSGSTGPVFSVGDIVLWDTVNLTAVRSGLGSAGIIPIGVCIEAAATTDTSVYTLLGRVPSWFQNKSFEDLSLTSASKTLDAEDSGKVLTITAGSASNVITLPSTAAGLLYVVRLGIGSHATTSRVAISPAAADKIMGADLAGVDNKDRILASTSVVAGDYIVLIGDGANGWFVAAERGLWTAES